MIVHKTSSQVFYTWVARSRSGSSSFTASALNKPSSSSSSSSSSRNPPPPPPPPQPPPHPVLCIYAERDICIRISIRRILNGAYTYIHIYTESGTCVYV